jgi:hypothetical protein
MKTRHTEGPWNVFIADDGGQWTGWPLSIEATNEEDKTVVRPGGFYPYTWDAAVSQTEAVANAHLMSASPDMLDALRAALPALEAAAATGTPAACEALETALAAIEKAIQKKRNPAERCHGFA